MTKKPWLDALLGVVFAAFAFPILFIPALLPLGLTEPDYASGVVWGIAVTVPIAILLFVSRWYRGMSLFGRIFWPAFFVSWIAALVSCYLVLKDLHLGF